MKPKKVREDRKDFMEQQKENKEEEGQNLI